MQKIKRVDFLKGLAIIAVLISHFISKYFSDYNLLFADGFVIMFFFISGYLTYLSLEKRLKKNNLKKVVKNFYIERFLRIYPLYLLGLTLSIYFWNQAYSITNYLIIYPLMSAHWFIRAIVHCYLFAFPLYYLIKKIGYKKYLTLLLILFYFIPIIPYFPYSWLHTSLLKIIYSYTYHNVFLSYIFVYALGMSVPLIKINKKITHYFNDLIILILIFLVSIVPNKLFNQVFADTLVIVTSFLILFILFILYVNKEKQIKFYFTNTISFLGEYTLSIYILHWYFYNLLHNLGIIIPYSFYSILSVVVLFPIFLKVCIFIEENYSKNLVKKYKSLFLSKINKKTNQNTQNKKNHTSKIRFFNRRISNRKTSQTK